MRKKVAMLVMNSCAPDPRVSKEAEALSSSGYNVRVYCLYLKSHPEEEIVNGVTYIRFHLMSPDIQKLKIWLANKFHPSRKKIIFNTWLTPLIPMTVIPPPTFINKK